MAGGLMQLVAYGAQDVYLTGNPQITFFKVVYRRHTNFAIESIELGFTGSPGFGKKTTCTISRNGDLVSNMVLQIKLGALPSPSSSWAWSSFLGHRIINFMEIEIGGQRIDKQYGEWLHLWNQLTLPEAKTAGYNKMIGHTLGVLGKRGADRIALNTNVVTTPAIPDAFQIATGGAGTIVPLEAADTKEIVLNIPLQFWFCRNPGLALPLIALQYHDVKVAINFATLNDCIKDYTGATFVASASATTASSNGAISFDANLFVDYIHLDTDERRRFAQLTHEYLIEQVQYVTEEISNSDVKISLPFNHPIKELVWTISDDATEEAGEHFTYVGDQTLNPLNPGAESDVSLVTGRQDGVNTCKEAVLKLNGQDRFSERSGNYFNLVQPYQHHTGIPYNGINSYSFALRPEEHQPSGTCNFSRLDNATLHIKVDSAAARTVRAYAVNYNVLRIMSGMGGLAYSN